MKPGIAGWTLAAVIVAGALLAAFVAEPRSVAGRGQEPVDGWRTPLGAMDEALVRGDVGAAARAHHEAYRAALGSRDWESMLGVGDAVLRLGAAAGHRRRAVPDARRAYFTALLRAQRQSSQIGVVRTGEAFAALGDRDAVAQCLRIAERMPASHAEPHAVDSLRAALERLGERAGAPHGLAAGERP